MNKLFANAVRVDHSSIRTLGVLGLILSAALPVPGGTQGTDLIEDVRAMLSGPGTDMEVRLRLTASTPASQRTVQAAQLTQERGNDGRIRTELVIEGADSAGRFCSICAPGGEMISCGESSMLELERPAGELSAFDLPWQELFGDRCMTRNVRHQEDIKGEDDKPLAVFDITTPAHSRMGYQRLYFSIEKRLPIRIERFDQNNNLTAEINVLNARHTRWGPAIRRLIYSEPDRDVEVLIEVRSIRDSRD